MNTSRWPDAFLGCAAAGALGLSAWLVPAGDQLLGRGGDPLPDVCWLRLTFGLDCLTCGLTRSFAAFMHGEWAAAFQSHPAGPFLVLGAAGVLVLTVALAVRRRPPLWGRAGFADAITAAALATVVLGLVRHVVDWV